MFKKTEEKGPLSEGEILYDMSLQAELHAKRFNKKSVTVVRRVKLGYTGVEKTLSFTWSAK